MFTPIKLGDETSGLFWSFTHKMQPTHSGGDPGVLTNMVFDPELNLGYFFMTDISADEDEGMINTLRETIRAIRQHPW